MTAFIKGFSLSITLILAIGAQNAFILRQGIARRFVLPLVMFCGLADALLITLGVFAAHAVTEIMQNAAIYLKLLGVAFLVFYGLTRFYSAIKGGHEVMGAKNAQTLKSALLTCAAMTFLNPHVYLDTVVLMGSMSLPFQGAEKVKFAIGAASASIVFFFSLGYGARLLSPLFQNARAWQVLDFLMGCLMLYLAYWLWSIPLH